MNGKFIVQIIALSEQRDNLIREKLKQDKGIRDEYEYIFRVLKGEEKNSTVEDAFLGQELLIRAMQTVKER